jgi:hypothetical protein
MEQPKEKAGQKIKIEIPPDMEALYANQVLIAHTPSELVFNFAQMIPGTKGPKVKAQIMMSPLGAKLFYRALGENLTKFEANFGEINMPVISTLADHLFKPPQKNQED